MPLQTKRKRHLQKARLMAGQVRKRQKLEREDVNPESEYQMEEQDVEVNPELEYYTEPEKQDICKDNSSNSSDESSSDDFDYESDSEDNDNEASADERNSATILQWMNGAGASLHVKGTGSATTQWREQQRRQKLQEAASRSFKITALFQRQRDLKQQEEAGEPKTVNLSEVQRVNHEVPTKKQELCLKAAEDLK